MLSMSQLEPFFSEAILASCELLFEVNQRRRASILRTIQQDAYRVDLGLVFSHKPRE
jgi:hypothetical protein